ncbi:hypothetical protein [Tautonia plasticadhaerens]|uniref:Uncharacterized protein n=1 Tax=Tautonia plasticadhaerens TaxID=2527974 RepID=A0A518H6C1_9BACT|nr:hypothetical protein [Tautonia plasticadhaerens]QDV36382.1 hypothetical protein ElP_43050 [Tautonia plasticadhaerens]
MSPKAKDQGDRKAALVEKLSALAEGLRRGEDLPISRVTPLKSLCQDREAAAPFALSLLRMVGRDLRAKRRPRRYRMLVEQAAKVLQACLDKPSGALEGSLRSLLVEMDGERRQARPTNWGVFLIVVSNGLLRVAEACLKAVLDPARASSLLYGASVVYAELQGDGPGTGLRPSAATTIEEIARFWRDRYGIE